MRVNQIQQPAPVEQVQNTAPTDGSFKFMLASHVEEAELQERLTNLMAEITTEGEKLAKKRDVKDMRHYRGLVKEFLNEVVTRSHSFSRETSWIGEAGTVCMALSGWWMRIWISWHRN